MQEGGKDVRVVIVRGGPALIQYCMSWALALQIGIPKDSYREALWIDVIIKKSFAQRVLNGVERARESVTRGVASGGNGILSLSFPSSQAPECIPLTLHSTLP